MSKQTNKLMPKTTKTDPSYDLTPTEVLGNVNNITTDGLFKLADLYFKQKNIMYSHMYNSFDKFLDEDIPNLLKNGNNIFFERIVKDKIFRYKFTFDDVAIKPPFLEVEEELMFPADARTRNMTYAVKLVATITQIQEVINVADNTVTTRMIGEPEREYPVAIIPILVRSKYCSTNLKKQYDNSECPYDPGAHFIVNGSEKVVMSQEYMIENRPMVFLKKDSSSMAYMAQVNSKSRHNDMIQVISIRMKKDNTLMLKVPIFQDVPVFIVMRALGVESDKDIINYIVYDKEDVDMLNIVHVALENSKPEGSIEKILTQEDAISYLINKMRTIKKYNETDKTIRDLEKRRHLEQMLRDTFMPHVEGGLKHKAFYLGLMINKLIHVSLDRIPVDDRDSYINKRVDLVGSLLFKLFKQFYKKMLNDCGKFFKKRNPDDENPFPIINQIKSNIIEQGLRTALLTGAWGKSKGVAQMLQRLTYTQTLSSLRRINSPTVDASTNKLTSPRHLHSTTIGPICYIETPEGHKVGLVKNLSLVGNITVVKNSQYEIVKNYVKTIVINMQDVAPDQFHRYTRVQLNGEVIGLTDEPRKIYNHLKQLKYENKFGPYISITHDIRSEIENKDLRIFCDSGRIFHPCLRVVNNKTLLTQDMLDRISIEETDNTTKITSWSEFMIKFPGVIEFLDSDERYNSMCAMTQKQVEIMRTRMIESTKKVPQMSEDEIRHVVNRYDEFSYVKYTHCEIHPSLLLGVVVSNSPFVECNQGPRNMYQYSQARQAMGIYATDYRNRLDISYILYHPQRPIVNTRTMKYINTDILPAGENCVVAIACYTGYNQEDSNILNRSSVDRGMFRSTSYKKTVSEVKKNQSTSQDDIFIKPDRSQVTGMRSGTYDKLNEKGFAPEETVLEMGDIIIGKVSPIQPIGNSNKIYKDSSEIYKFNIPGAVDRVYTNIYNQEGYEIRKIRVRSERKPMIGDKFCFLDTAEVLTTDGWKNITQVTKNDLVATITDLHVLEYVHPVDTYAYEYNGDMYNLRSPFVDIDVTAEHELFVKTRDSAEYRLMPANEVSGKVVRFKKDCRNPNEDVATITLPATDEHSQWNVNVNDMLELLSLFLSMGTIENNTIIFHAVDHNHVLAIVAAAIKLDQVVETKELCYTVNNRQLATFWNQLNVEPKDRRLPKWLWTLSQSQCFNFLEALVKTPMCEMKHGQEILVTPSHNMADDLMILAIHAGCSAMVARRDDMYCVVIHRAFNAPEIGAHDMCHETWYTYHGKVWCIEVPSHVFMVRQNGKNVIIGNCSRAAQKGTTGILLSASDMPFTADGIQPDMIINANAIPSRMTVAQLHETLFAKYGAVSGQEIDGTPFCNFDSEPIKEALRKLGYRDNGCEDLYNGMTGKIMPVSIFIGPMYYQRLKHMVADKIHSRSRGPRTLLTRQPPEGRSREGGLRFGEMERDCIISHGMSRFLKERLLETADVYIAYVCDICGLFAQRFPMQNRKAYATKKDIFYCPACRNKTDISKIRIPYAFKLLLQELMSMNIAPRIRTKK